MNMKYNLKKIFLIFTAIILAFNFSSCFIGGGRDAFVFSEGVFEYDDEPIVFYKDITINRIVLTFTRVDDGTFGKNIMKSRKDNKKYHVDFYLEDQTGRGVNCLFTSLPKSGHKPDAYLIILEVADFVGEDNTIAKMRITIENSKYYKLNDDREDNTQAEVLMLQPVSGPQTTTAGDYIGYDFPPYVVLLKQKNE